MRKIMLEPERDTIRAKAAILCVLDQRDIHGDMGSILVTLEHTVAALLVSIYPDEPHKAAQMLNYALLQGIEDRISLYASRKENDK
jgi:hypothetical protein